MNKHKRLVWPDVLKCFAIFLVIIGHVVSAYDDRIYDAPINQWIYSFHMPLFMMLSGLFFKYSLNKSFKSVLCGKTIQLLVPLCTWSIVGLFIGEFLLTNINNWGYIKSYILSGGPLRGYWYLKCLFIYVIFNFGLIKIVRNNYLATGISIIVFMIIPNINFMRMMIPFFWLGYYYEKIGLRLPTIPSLIISGGMMILCYLLFDTSCNYLSAHQSVKEYMQYLIIGLTSSIFWISLFKLVIPSEANQYLILFQDIGKQSLGIYCCHSFFNNSAFWNPIYSTLHPNTYTFIIAAATILIISYILTKLLAKNRLTSLLFLGNRYGK